MEVKFLKLSFFSFSCLFRQTVAQEESNTQSYTVSVCVCHMSFQQQCNHPAKLKGNICSSRLISKVRSVDTMQWESSITYLAV